ncbi:helix-turn-helix domain-containing protein [soil metagenome]
MEKSYYQEVRPSEALKPFVQHYWILESRGPATLGTADKVLPYGHPEIGFIYGDDYRFYQEGQEPALLPKSFVAGQFCQSYFLEPTGATGVIGIKFSPTGLFDLFQVSMQGLTNRITDFVELGGDEAEEMARDIIAATPNDRRIEVIEAYLLGKLAKRKAQMGLMQRTVDMILKEIGNVSLSDICEKVNISSRQLERKFKEQIGLSPKLFSRVVRVNHAMKLLRTNPEYNWQDIIYLCGYYDQAHFIKDFKDIAGECPTMYLTRSYSPNAGFRSAYAA